MVELTGVADMVGLQLAVGQVPHLEGGRERYARGVQ